MQLHTQLEDLFEQNASDFEISKAFKEAIKEYKNSLHHTQQVNIGKEFLVNHTKTLDNFITLMYKAVIRKFFGNYTPMRNAIPISFIALGSYGREQLAIYSDIDLLIAYEEVAGYNTKEIIESFIHIAWDAKLDLGYRVHEIKDLSVVSQEDITIRTALMESRFISGSHFVWSGVQKELKKARMIDQTNYLKAKTQEALQRREKYPRSMQPNLKEGVGGLRDANFLFWVAMTRFGDGNLRHYYNIYFTEQEYKEYRMALELLFRVRSALHLCAGKKQDQLILEYIPQVRKMLNIKSDLILSRKVLDAMHTINLFSLITAQKMLRNFYAPQYNLKQLKSFRYAKGVYLIDGTLFATFDTHPFKAADFFELILRLPDENLAADASFLALTKAIILPTKSTKSYRQLIYKLFKRRNTYWILAVLFKSNVLDRIISQLEKVRNLAQFDGYHHYPVLTHSLESVKALETISDDKAAVLYEVMPLEDRAFLKLVVLMHDAGKGRRMDHHEVGAKLFEELAHQFGLNSAFVKLGIALIKHHTLMSNIAFREDIYHEKTLYTFMSIIEDKRTLDMLFVLTYADITGVGPNTYSAFNSKLLHTLYDNALEVIDQKSQLDEAAKRLKRERALQKNSEFLALPKINQKKILAIASNLFFIKHSSAEILALVKKAQDIDSYRYFVSSQSHLSIEIFRKIPLNIGYLLSKLSRMSIVSMEIFTLYNNLKYFRIDFDTKVSPDEITHIHEIIDKSFDMTNTITLADIIIKPEDITLNCNHSISYASMHIHTKDQKGLLAFIMAQFEKESIDIATAKIHTIKNRVRDQFLIEKSAKICQNETKIINLLTKKA